MLVGGLFTVDMIRWLQKQMALYWGILGLSILILLYLVGKETSLWTVWIVVGIEIIPILTLQCASYWIEIAKKTSDDAQLKLLQNTLRQSIMRRGKKLAPLIFVVFVLFFVLSFRSSTDTGYGPFISISHSVRIDLGVELNFKAVGLLLIAINVILIIMTYTSKKMLDNLGKNTGTSPDPQSQSGSACSNSGT